MKKLSESVWMDIHRRSNGDQERKEDDINLLDLDEFCKYLNRIYHMKEFIYNGSSGFVKAALIRGDHIKLHLYSVSVNSTDSYMKWIDYDCTDAYVNDEIFDEIGCTEEMKDMYNLKYENGKIYIYPKDNSNVNNAFFLKLVEYILSKIENPLKVDIVKTEKR